MDPVSYNPIKAKPKVNVTPSFSASAAPRPEAEPEQVSETPKSPLPSRSLQRHALSTWDIRFTLGMVLVIILINTALVVVFSYDKAKGLAALVPSAGGEKSESVSLQELDTRPVRTSRDLPGESTTSTYITPEKQQILLRPLNGSSSEEIDEFEGEPVDEPVSE